MKVRNVTSNPGQNVGFTVARPNKSYGVYVREDGLYVGLGCSNGQGGWVDLMTKRLSKPLGKEYEVVIVVMGSNLLMYLDGEWVLGYEFNDDWKGPVRFGMNSHLGTSTFRNVQIMKLDDEFVPPTSKAEYASLATGEWVSLAGDEADFQRCMTAQDTLDFQSGAKFADGIIDCESTSLYFPSQAAENFILRARIKKVEGHHLRLLARNSDQEYAINWNGGNLRNPYFGIGRATSPHWYPAKHGPFPEILPDYFELALALIDGRIVAYVDGSRFLDIALPKEATGNWIAGIGVGDKCHALYRNIEIMPLPSDAVLPSDYASFATGHWEDLVADEEAFKRCLEVQKEIDRQSEATFDNGMIDLESDYLFFPQRRGKNFILRTLAKNEGGKMHINLRIVDEESSYVAYWNSANSTDRYFGIGRSGGGTNWQNLQNGIFPEEIPEYVEYAIASIDQRILVFVDGRKFLEVADSSEDTANRYAGIGATNAHGKFKNMQYMALPDDVILNKLSERDEPDFLAAREALFWGGIIGINGDDTEIRTPYFLPDSPLELTSVNFSYVHNWNEEAFTVFDKCTHIRSLTISGMSHVSGDALRHFSQNKSFRKLDFNSSGLIGDGMVHLAGCKDLEILYIWGTKLGKDDLLTFAQCPLKDINFGATAIQDDWLTQFTNLDGLQAINIRYTSVGDQGFAAFKNCKDLKRLSVDHTKITDQGIAYFHDCSKLEELAVANTNITDDGLLPFTSCKNLRLLDVSNTKVTPEAVAKFRKALPECKIKWEER